MMTDAAAENVITVAIAENEGAHEVGEAAVRTGGKVDKGKGKAVDRNIPATIGIEGSNHDDNVMSHMINTFNNNHAFDANGLMDVQGLGPEDLEAFYPEGSIFGYNHLEATDPPPEAIAPPSPKKRTNRNNKIDGDQEPLETETLDAFYRRYFDLFPEDSNNNDIDSDYEDEEAENSNMDAAFYLEFITDFSNLSNSTSKKKRRLDNRTRISVAQQRQEINNEEDEDEGEDEYEDARELFYGDDDEDAENDDEEDEEKEEKGGRRSFKDRTVSGISVTRQRNETSEDRYVRVALELRLKQRLADKLAEVQISNPRRKVLTDSETHYIYLEHRSSISLATASTNRRQRLAKTTKASYDSYQKHWRRWCKRKGYRIGGKVDFRVLLNRFILYMEEGVAITGNLGFGDRRKAVLSFFAKKKEAGRRVKEVPALKPVLSYVCSVVDLYTKQREIGMLGMHSTGHPRSTAYQGLIDTFKKRIAGDPRMVFKKYATINHADGKELEKVQQLMRAAWTNRYNIKSFSGKKIPQKITSVRSRLIASWSHFMMMRGENIRYAKLPHINHHFFSNMNGSALSGGSTSSTFALALIMSQGKTMRYGGVNYGTVVRNVDVEICPVGSLAFYQFCLWDLEGTRVQPPTFNDTFWESQYLVFGSGQYSMLSPNAHLDGMVRLFETTSIFTDQPTHIWRHMGANHAQDAGASIPEIQQHSGWCKDSSRLTTHYLHPLPKGVAYAMAGSSQPGRPPWIKRSLHVPPVELQRTIFPFIEDHYSRHVDWLQWTSNIMDNKPDMHNRTLSEKFPYPFKTDMSGILKLKFLLLLVHLRKVLLQDAAVLQRLRPDNDIDYSLHHVFKRPVFKTQAFNTFSQELHQTMDDAVPPLSDSLRALVPALTDEIRNLNTKVSSGIAGLKKQLDDVVANLTSRFQDWQKRTETKIITAVNNVASSQNDLLIAAIDASVNMYSEAMMMTMQFIPELFQSNMRYLQQRGKATTPPTISSASSAPHWTQHATSLSQHIRLQVEQSNQQRQQDQPSSSSQDQLVDTPLELDQPCARPSNTGSSSQSSLSELSTKPHQAQSSSVQAISDLDLKKRLDELAYQLAMEHNPTHPFPEGVKYEMIGREPLREQWNEWFYGRVDKEGVRQPSIWRLNGKHRHHTFAQSYKDDTTWRYVDPAKDRGSYKSLWKWKKNIVGGVLTRMLEIPGLLKEWEEIALTELEQSIKSGTQFAKSQKPIRYYLEMGDDLLKSF